MKNQIKSALALLLGQEQPSASDQERAVASQLHHHLASDDSQIAEIDQMLADSWAKIQKAKGEKSRPKRKSKTLLVLLPVAAIVLAGVFVLPKLLFSPVQLESEGKQIALGAADQGGFDDKSTQYRKNKIGQEVTFDYKLVKGLKAEKNGDALTLSVKACDCGFAFKADKIKRLIIKAPQSQFFVLGTAFRLKISEDKETLQVTRGLVKVVFEQRDYFVKGGHGWDSERSEVYKLKKKKKKKKKRTKHRKKKVAKRLTRGIVVGSNIMIILKDKTRLPAKLKKETKKTVVVEIDGRQVRFAKAKIRRVIKR